MYVTVPGAAAAGGSHPHVHPSETATGGARAAIAAPGETTAVPNPQIGVGEQTISELMAAARDGDQGAWDQLVERYSPMLWGITRRFRLSEADAADVCQTTWLRLVEHIHVINDPERLGGWLATTGRREAIAVLRHQRTAPIPNSDLDLPLADDWEEDDPAATVLREDELAQLRNAFARLPPQARRVTKLWIMGGRSDAIGAALGISPSTARVHLHHSLDTLRALLKPL